jgi:hypothetical protein
LGKDLQIKLLVELGKVTLRRGGEQFGGECRQNAVIAGGVIAQRLLQHRSHQTGVAGTGNVNSRRYKAISVAA